LANGNLASIPNRWG